MFIFKEFNKSTNCKICGTNKDGKGVLIPIDGTEKDGNAEAEQVHLDCINLRLALVDNSSNCLVYQIFSNDSHKKL